MMGVVRGLTRRLPIIIPFFWLLIFFLTPFFIVLQISFAEFQYGQPPYVPNFRKVEGLGDFSDRIKQQVAARVRHKYRSHRPSDAHMSSRPTW